MKIVTFAGYEWEIKQSESPVGPGPNVFSDKGVYVDAEGMHLSVWYENDTWHCSEAVLSKPLGYGTYAFTVSTPLSPMEKRVVFGAFLYENDTQEIDIEVSRRMVGRDRAQFVIQPGSTRGNIQKYTIPCDTPLSFNIIWTQEQVHFKASKDESSSVLLSEWIYPSAGITSPDVARFIWNLWLFQGKSARHPQSLTIQDFSFSPLPS